MPYFGGDCWNESIEKERCFLFKCYLPLVPACWSAAKIPIIFRGPVKFFEEKEQSEFNRGPFPLPVGVKRKSRFIGDPCSLLFSSVSIPCPPLFCQAVLSGRSSQSEARRAKSEATAKADNQ